MTLHLRVINISLGGRGGGVGNKGWAFTWRQRSQCLDSENWQLTLRVCPTGLGGRGPGRWIGAQEFCQSGEVDVFTDNAKNETSGATVAF